MPDQGLRHKPQNLERAYAMCTNVITINDGLALFERVHALRKQADALNCRIELSDRDPEEGLDFGPFVLLAEDGVRVWEFGLPLAGIADALGCFDRELAGDEKAWT